MYNYEKINIHIFNLINHEPLIAGPSPSQFFIFSLDVLCQKVLDTEL